MLSSPPPNQESTQRLMASMNKDLIDAFRIMQSDVMLLVSQAADKGWTVEELENKIDALLIDPNNTIDIDEIVEEEMNDTRQD